MSTILAVYHPPYSEKAPITNAMFLDEVTDFLANFLIEHNNIIIAGDFNIHVNNTNDPEAQVFLDTMEVLGLDNHVNFATHNRGNTLDLVLTEVLSSLSVVTCEQGPFLSDHCCIELEVAIPKPALKRLTITSRNINDVVTEDLVKELDLGTIEGKDVNDLVNQLECKCKKALDTLAPEETKCVTIRQKKYWLTKEVLDQKRRVRRREKIWQKYKTEGTWKALVEHRNVYNAMIREEKLKPTLGKVEECKGDTRKLYSLVRYLTGTKVQNTMPSSTGDRKLANDFADYFIEKIQKIWDNLDTNPKFKPTRNTTITPLKIFKPTTVDEVTTTIMGMKTKSCELDFLPTSLLKKALPYIINTITNIINVSLEQGVFPDSWKMAIIRPLLKNLALN